MSTLPENELDLEKLFLPAWAQEPPSAKHYATYEGEDEKVERKGPRRDRPPGRRPSGQRPGRPGDRPRENRPRGDQRGPSDRPQGRRPFERRPGMGGREENRERREPPAPLPEVNITFGPDERGVDSLARQIKTTGRAYPLFDIARLILQKPERYSVTFGIKKNAEGKPVQPLVVCALDETLWLSEDEAVGHVLKNHFGTFYQAERTATEPPKGKYTFVAQCGLSGVILGPPNYHDYQNQLRKLHAERFSRMPFEAYKSRVRIVRDEAVVKQWIDDQSWKTDYVCLNLPETIRLATRDAVEKHFKETHKDNIIKPVEAHTLSGQAARSLRSPGLTRLVRQLWEDQKRFPLQLATSLSQQFAGHGLQFFKVNRAITHVSVARPHFLDLEKTPVSDGVKRIVDYVNAHPRCSRRQLIETLSPSPAPAPLPVNPAPAAEGAAPVAEANQPTPEQTAIIADLHWLIHQGHVIEFANGVMETAKKPLPKPPKPAKAPEAQAGEPAAESSNEAAAAAEAVPSAESLANEGAMAEPPTVPGESTDATTNPETAAPTSQNETQSLPPAPIEPAPGVSDAPAPSPEPGPAS